MTLAGTAYRFEESKLSAAASLAKHNKTNCYGAFQGLSFLTLPNNSRQENLNHADWTQ
jgi:hypothetical protein